LCIGQNIACAGRADVSVRDLGMSVSHPRLEHASVLANGTRATDKTLVRHWRD
jgi:hypothetical protein